MARARGARAGALAWADPAARRRRAIAVEWFNSVWKVPPNAIDGELASGSPDAARIAAWSAEMGSSLPLFDGLLEGRDFLLGDRLGVLDVVRLPIPQVRDDRAGGRRRGQLPPRAA